jgi:hypothetical protein
MALQAVTKRYLGPNTGFMHIAACFSNDNFIFLHHQYAGDSEWIYPNQNNFFEDEPIESVIQRALDKWLPKQV